MKKILEYEDISLVVTTTSPRFEEASLIAANELGIETIAEFVAEEEIYNKIKDLHIDYSQGYYFSQPNQNLIK